MERRAEEQESAVSPVVGVMLMLVVTIIIAAVVSGFAGGLAGTTQKAPQLAMDVKIVNTGYAASSYILFDVQGVSEPIPTKDLKISTSWSKYMGNAMTGGNTVTAGQSNTHYSTYEYHSPIGYGAGVNSDIQQKTSGSYTPEQCFGKYTLVPGTTMKSTAVGYAGTTYSYGYGVEERYKYYLSGSYWDANSADGMMAILGEKWNDLRPGDIVDVKITHIPSGKIVFDKSVGVEG